MKIQYLNTDLVLISPVDLAPLVSAMKRRGVFALYGCEPDGHGN